MTDSSTTENDTLPPKYILSLDGGGVRGLFTYNILKKIKKLIGCEIHNKFDLYVGTSIGGLLCLVMSQHDCCNIDCKLQTLFDDHHLNTIFDKSIWDKVLGYAQFCPIYDGRGKRKVIREHMECKTLGEIQENVALTTWNMTKFRGEVFASYKNEQKDILVTDVADATSAAPIYFPAVQIGQDYYVDGGVAANNPIMVAYTEARTLWPENPLYVLSIGTGIKPEDKDWSTSAIQGWGAPQWFSNGIVDLLMDAPCDMTQDQMEKLLATDKRNRYLRLNGMVPKIDMDDCTTENLQALRSAASLEFAAKKKEIAAFFAP